MIGNRSTVQNQGDYRGLSLHRQEVDLLTGLLTRRIRVT